MMIHPSYKEMISKINEGSDMDEAPLVTSRYSIVIAAAKRARQIVSGDDTMVPCAPNDKPLSAAVRELYEDKVHILPADAPEVAYPEGVLADEAAEGTEEEASASTEEASDAEAEDVAAEEAEEAEEVEESEEENEEDSEEA